MPSLITAALWLLAKLWKLSKALIVFFSTLIVLLIYVLYWVADQPLASNKLVARVGGSETLHLQKEISYHDRQYLDSLTETPVVDDYNTETEMPCTESTDTCITSNLTQINKSLRANRPLSPLLAVLYTKYKTTPSLFEFGCPAKLEITLMFGQFNRARYETDPDHDTINSIQRAVIPKILVKGGILNNLNTSGCKFYFSERPHIARQYLKTYARLLLEVNGTIDEHWKTIRETTPDTKTIEKPHIPHQIYSTRQHYRPYSSNHRNLLSQRPRNHFTKQRPQGA